MNTAHDVANETHMEIAREKKRKYYYEHREAILAKMRYKYRNDAEFRKRRSEYRREQYLKSKLKGLIDDETT